MNAQLQVTIDKEYLRQTLVEVLEELLPKASAAPDIMNIKQLCIYWNVTRSSVTKWIREKDLPVHNLGGALRFHRTEVNDWSRQQGLLAKYKKEAKAK